MFKAHPDLPRAGLIWLLVAHALVVLPQFYIYLPIWVLPMWLICFVWRIGIYKTRLNYPKLFVKIFLVAGLGAGMILAYGNILNPESGSILLVATFSLKLIESKTTRDGWVLIFLAYALIVVGFLFETSIFYAFYNVLILFVITGAMFGLQNNIQGAQAKSNHIKSAVKSSSLLLFQALPLMIILFVIFPRFPPLWQLPGKSEPADPISGLSDTMNPNDISKLSQSKTTSFWAEFADNIPQKKQLYWRALVFDQFDGRTWNASTLTHMQTLPIIQARKFAIPYKVIMEPTYKTWIYALEISDNTEPSKLNMFNDARLESRIPISQKFSYSLTAHLEYELEPTALSNWLYLQNINLPEGNARARAWGKELAQQFKGDPQAIAATIWSNFQTQEFFYTLEPTVMGTDTVDDFLYEQRRGFCGHYASSFAFVMRAAGVPTRVVTGFQGGEIDYDNKRVQVRNLDAHAWNEYWVQGKGWIRIDPTAAVAPNRIEMGLLSELGEEQASEITGTNTVYGKFRDKLERFAGLVNYKWTSVILGYQQNNQANFLKSLLGSFSWVNLVIYSIIAACLFFFIQLLLIIKPWQARKPAYLRYFNALIAHLKLFDDDFNTNMTTKQLTKSDKIPALLIPPLMLFNQYFEQLIYTKNPHKDGLIKLKRALSLVLRVKPNKAQHNPRNKIVKAT
ncbi:transglutaminase [Gammaproteobacteria bacterium]|nr:transglutaminase [Gammaproteobacteria bacterium]